MKLFSKTSLSIGLLIGLGFVTLSYLWPSIRPVASQWTEMDQAKLTEAAGEFHSRQPKASQARQNGDPNADRIEADFKHWKQEWEQNMNKLASIQNQSNMIANIFYYSGIVIAVACSGALVYLREEHEKEKG